MNRNKFTEEKERILLDPQAGPIARANAIWCMEVDGIQRHEDLIVSFLDHDVGDLRVHALVILLRWGRYAYVPLALDWLVSEADYSERSHVALALSNVAVASPQHRQTILSALVSAVDRDPSAIAAARAYKAVLFVLAPDRRSGVDEEHFDRQKDVDQNMLAPYRARRALTPS